MTDLYNITSERLWEKLEYYRDQIDTSWVNFSEPFLIDQLVKKNPLVNKLIDEVQEEFKYYMSEFQCSWAVSAFLRNDMEEYNKKYGRNLQARI